MVKQLKNKEIHFTILFNMKNYITIKIKIFSFVSFTY